LNLISSSISGTPMWGGDLQMKSYLTLNLTFFVVILGGFSEIARAELDPELAELSSYSVNRPSIVVGGGVGFGQSQGAGGLSSGISSQGWVQFGFMAPRGSWNRVEGNLWLAKGSLSFKSENEQTHEVDGELIGMARFGYGYSLGNLVYGVLKVGVGPFWANYIRKEQDITLKTSESFVGLVGMFGWEAQFPFGENFELLGGVELQHYQFDVGDLLAQGQLVSGTSESFNINALSCSVGLNVKL
jgi:hypothetical protein